MKLGPYTPAERLADYERIYGKFALLYGKKETRCICGMRIHQDHGWWYDRSGSSHCSTRSHEPKNPQEHYAKRK